MHIVGISCGIAYPAANFELREYYLQALNRVGLGGIIVPPPDLPRTALYESAAALAGRVRTRFWAKRTIFPPTTSPASSER